MKSSFIKKLFSAVLTTAVLVSTSVVALAETIDTNNLTWTYDSGTKTLTFTATDPTRPATIPDYTGTGYNARPWHSIASNVTKIVIEGGIADIGNHSLREMSNVETVEMEEGVTTIGQYAFYLTGKNKNVSFHIPASVTTIEGNVFDVSSSSKDIIVTFADRTSEQTLTMQSPAESDAVKNAKKYFAFNKDNTIVENQLKDTGLTYTTYSVDGTVLTIGGNGVKPYTSYVDNTKAPWRTASSDMGNIERIVVEGTVKNIGDYAFAGYDTKMSKVKYIEIKEGVESVGKKAFYVNQAKEILLPSTLTTVGENAFYHAGGSGNKAIVVFPGTATKTLGTNAFRINSGSGKITKICGETGSGIESGDYASYFVSMGDGLTYANLDYVVAYNKTSDPKSGVMVFANYESERLYDVKTMSFTLPANNYELIDVNDTGIEMHGSSRKAFFWDSLTNIAPIYNAAVITN